MQRASYRNAVSWIAENDEPGDHDHETVAEMISVVLIAEIFGVAESKVARDVIRYRDKHDI